jgi:hypothetical protein
MIRNNIWKQKSQKDFIKEIDDIEVEIKALQISYSDLFDKIYSNTSKFFLNSISTFNKVIFEKLEDNNKTFTKEKTESELKYTKDIFYGVCITKYIDLIVNYGKKTKVSSEPFYESKLDHGIDISFLGNMERTRKIELGKKIHSLLSELLFVNKKVSSPFHSSVDSIEFGNPGIFETKERLHGTIESLKDILHIIEKLHFIFVASEYPIWYGTIPVISKSFQKLTRQWLYGRCDLIIYDPLLQKTVLVDYKVSISSDKIFEKYIWELRLQTLCLHSMGITIDEIWILYIVVKNDSTKIKLHKIPFELELFINCIKKNLHEQLPETFKDEIKKKDIQEYWNLFYKDLIIIYNRFKESDKRIQ